MIMMIMMMATMMATMTMTTMITMMVEGVERKNSGGKVVRVQQSLLWRPWVRSSSPAGEARDGNALHAGAVPHNRSIKCNGNQHEGALAVKSLRRRLLSPVACRQSSVFCLLSSVFFLPSAFCRCRCR